MSDVEHQPRAHRILQQALASQRMPHAYLFSGPEGVGKEMMAMGLAQTLLCSSPVRRRNDPSRDREGAVSASPLPHGRGSEAPSHPRSEEIVDACGQCQDCRLASAGTHPDLAVIYRQLNRQHPDSTIRKQKALVLVVDVIRHFLVEKAGTFPNRGRARVFIVREAERMNDAAQNSLLKTLEEPPKSTFLILLTSSMDRMLPTTRSRCQQVQFQTLPAEFILKRLKALRPDAGAPPITYAARHTGGSLGAALRQIDDGLFEIKRGWGQRLIELSEPGVAPHALAKPFEADAKILGKAVSERDPDVSDTDATRAGLQVLLSVLADFHVDALRKATGANLPPINEDQPEVIRKLAAAHTTDSILASLRHLREADANLGRNANIELTLESLFIRLAQANRAQVAV